MNSQLLLIIISPLSACFGFMLKIFIENYSEKIKKNNKEKLDQIEYKLKEFYFPIYINLLRENSIWNKIIAIYTNPNTKSINIEESHSTIDILDVSMHNPSFDSPLSPIHILPNQEINTPIQNNLSNRRNLFKLKPIITKPIISEETNKIMLELDKEILSIHLINQQIIHNHIIKINPNEELLKLLLKYDEHITIYNILRKMYPNLNNFKQIKFPSNFNAEYPYKLKNIIEEQLYKLKIDQNLLSN